MRRFRNPAYATEFLERKLSPSGILGVPVAAEVSTPTTATSSSAASEPGSPTPGGGSAPDPFPAGPPGAPPVIPTSNPTNPSIPG